MTQPCLPVAVTAIPDRDRPLLLVDLPCGRAGTVLEVEGEDVLAHRLQALGFWPGTCIEKIGAAPFGDPMLFRLHGFRLALRRREAARVLIKVIQP